MDQRKRYTVSELDNEFSITPRTPRHYEDLPWLSLQGLETLTNGVITRLRERGVDPNR